MFDWDGSSPGAKEEQDLAKRTALRWARNAAVMIGISILLWVAMLLALTVVHTIIDMVERTYP